VRRRIFERAAARDPVTAELVALALEAPHRALARFVDLLAAYWHAGFGDEWRRIEPLLAQAVTDTGQRLAADGLYAVFDDLWPELRADRAREVVWVERTHEHDVVITADRPFVLTPSVYTWPHLHVECDDPWPLGLVYPTPAVRRGARPPLPPDRLVRLLRALGDDTRLRALRLLAAQPRSTQELAPLLGITEGALSKHLRLLADVGLLETRREGYYVLYQLVDEQLARLAPALQQFLRPAQARHHSHTDDAPSLR
jgi:DNA-binding transcriptional ArsR family regulator